MEHWTDDGAVLVANEGPVEPLGSDIDIELICAGCDREPHEIAEYVEAALAERQYEGHGNQWSPTPAEYVWEEEGTLNRNTGQFLCTECYIAAGMPSSPSGWVAPGPPKPEIFMSIGGEVYEDEG